VLQRVLQLPVVSSTCESLQRTYTSTKEVHPFVASVCEVYEQGVKGASALAMWSMEPVVRRLEPQCESIRRDVVGYPTVGKHLRSPLAQLPALFSTLLSCFCPRQSQWPTLWHVGAWTTWRRRSQPFSILLMR